MGRRKKELSTKQEIENVKITDVKDDDKKTTKQFLNTYELGIYNLGISDVVIQIEFFENEALNVSLPEKLSCVVKETEPTIKGQTAANSSKPAILDNGLRIMVPQFIAEGETIIVSTETCEYLERS